MTASSHYHPAQAGIKATVIGLIINSILAIVKGLAGYFGNSYALIGDAIESVTDVVASLLVWWGLALSARPPDANHPQGHGKAEPLAAVAVGFFLMLAAVLVAYQSVREILTPHTIPASWTLLVLVAVVAIKGLLSRYAFQVSEDISSLAVKGDAWHHSSDAITSAAAFIGISVALLGSHFSPDPIWSSADDWAALLTAVLIAFNGVRIIRPALYELTDARPDPALEQEIRDRAILVAGVLGLHKCLIRKMGFEYYVELDVCVDPNMSVSEAHAIAHSVQDKLKADISDKRIAKVLVHIEPFKDVTGN